MSWSLGEVFWDGMYILVYVYHINERLENYGTLIFSHFILGTPPWLESALSHIYSPQYCNHRNFL